MIPKLFFLFFWGGGLAVLKWLWGGQCGRFSCIRSKRMTNKFPSIYWFVVLCEYCRVYHADSCPASAIKTNCNRTGGAKGLATQEAVSHQQIPSGQVHPNVNHHLLMTYSISHLSYRVRIKIMKPWVGPCALPPEESSCTIRSPPTSRSAPGCGQRQVYFLWY